MRWLTNAAWAVAALATPLAPGAGAATLTVLHSFGVGADASTPSGPLVVFRNRLYGTSETGGANGKGAIFSYGLSTLQEHVVFSFALGSGYNPNGGLAVAQGVLYGTASLGGMGGSTGNGTLFQFDPSSNTYTVIYDLASSRPNALKDPLFSVIDLNGTLWGTTSGGADIVAGGVFSYALASSKFQKVYSFPAPPPTDPYSPLTLMGGLLYGETEKGGGVKCADLNAACGAIYSIDPASGAETTAHSFDGTDGAIPQLGLLSYGKYLYGVVGNTPGDVANSDGGVFRWNPITGRETVLHSFTGVGDGTGPASALVAMNGLLYGTTANGGSAGYGTVYSIDPQTGAETVVYSFTGGADGRQPRGLVASNGVLYGTTSVYFAGTLYSLTP